MNLYPTAIVIALFLCSTVPSKIAFAENAPLSSWLKQRLRVHVLGDGESLYYLQQELILPARSASASGDSAVEDLLIQRMTRVMNDLVSLQQLRKAGSWNGVTIDDSLRDTARFGSGARRIFPTKKFKAYRGIRRVFPSLGRERIVEYRLATVQFSYLLSSMVKNFVKYKRFDKNLNALPFAKEVLPFLLRDLLLPYWGNVEAWHFSGPFPNMRDRTRARLANPVPERMKNDMYYRAFTDEDFFLFAIAADLLFILQADSFLVRPLNLKPGERARLEEIRVETERVMRHSVPGNTGFRFDEGMWSSHPEYQHVGCPTGSKPPETPCPPVKKLTYDTSHAHRLPWWLESFRDSWPKQSVEHGYYGTLLRRLGDQLVEHVIEYEGIRPKMRNFLDGTNGWYRVRYEGRAWGYGPYALAGTETALFGSWYILARYHEKMRLFQQRLCRVFRSNDRKDVAFRTKYYGERVGEAISPFGYGNRDRFGPGSYGAGICQLAERYLATTSR